MAIQKISSQVIPVASQGHKPAFKGIPGEGAGGGIKAIAKEIGAGSGGIKAAEQDFGWIKMIVAKIKDWQ